MDPANPVDIKKILKVLRRMEELSPQQARVVKMRLFGRLREEQIAEVLQVSVRTVKREWHIARAWMYAELKGEGQEPAGEDDEGVPVPKPRSGPSRGEPGTAAAIPEDPPKG
jgi:hypothetical protein